MLYVETNFPMAVAKGQDREAHRLLETVLREVDSPSVQLIMPSVCYMEALSVLSYDRKQRGKFQEDLRSQLREVGRDNEGVSASELYALLKSSEVQFGKWLSVVKFKLYQALIDLSRAAVMIDLNADVLHESLQTSLIDDPTDNLILFMILAHARSSPAYAKAFVSDNSNDFGQPDVIKALEDAGVRYFRRTEAALGWLRSQPES